SILLLLWLRDSTGLCVSLHNLVVVYIEQEYGSKQFGLQRSCHYIGVYMWAWMGLCGRVCVFVCVPVVYDSDGLLCALVTALRSSHCSPPQSVLSAPVTALRSSHCSPLQSLLSAPVTALRSSHCSPPQSMLCAPVTALRSSHPSPLQSPLSAPVTARRSVHCSLLTSLLSAPVTALRSSHCCISWTFSCSVWVMKLKLSALRWRPT